jgi:hypothetical protein
VSGAAARLRQAGGPPAAIIARMLASRCAETSRSGSLGLNCTYSVPASTIGMCPGGR